MSTYQKCIYSQKHQMCINLQQQIVTKQMHCFYLFEFYLLLKLLYSDQLFWEITEIF